MFIELKNESGHVVMLPLWKLPQYVAKAVDEKRGDITKIKADQEAAEAAQKAAEEAKRQEEIHLADALNVPFDLATDPGV